MFLKQIFAREAKNMLVLRTSNFQGATIRPIASRHKISIVFIEGAEYGVCKSADLCLFSPPKFLFKSETTSENRSAKVQR